VIGFRLPGDGAVGDDPGDGVDGFGEQVAAAGEALQHAPPLVFGDGVFDRDALGGLGLTLGFPGDLALWWGAGAQFERWRADLVGMVFGQDLVAGVNQQFDIGIQVEERVDAFDADRGGVVHTARSGSAAQRRAVFIGGEGGLDRVLLDLATRTPCARPAGGGPGSRWRPGVR
jgi:hypothetical protein